MQACIDQLEVGGKQHLTSVKRRAREVNTHLLARFTIDFPLPAEFNDTLAL